MSELRREIRFFPAWDKRSDDPKKNYGIHGVQLTFYVHGDKGSVQFVLYTNWQLPHVTKELDAKTPSDVRFPHLFCHPLPADIGYHSPKPMYKGQKPMAGECTVLDGKKCYYDGSSLAAVDAYELLLSEGDEGVWKYLERYYADTFERRNEKAAT